MENKNLPTCIKYCFYRIFPFLTYTGAPPPILSFHFYSAIYTTFLLPLCPFEKKSPPYSPFFVLHHYHPTTTTTTSTNRGWGGGQQWWFRKFIEKRRERPKQGRGWVVFFFERSSGYLPYQTYNSYGTFPGGYCVPRSSDIGGTGGFFFRRCQRQQGYPPTPWRIYHGGIHIIPPPLLRRRLLPRTGAQLQQPRRQMWRQSWYVDSPLNRPPPHDFPTD